MGYLCGAQNLRLKASGITNCFFLPRQLCMSSPFVWMTLQKIIQRDISKSTCTEEVKSRWLLLLISRVINDTFLSAEAGSFLFIFNLRCHLTKFSCTCLSIRRQGGNISRLLPLTRMGNEQQSTNMANVVTLVDKLSNNFN